MLENKRAELTTKQLVTIIILIVSFIIILFLIFQLNLGGTTDKEICHNSVVLKGQSQIVAGPLDCRTSYICISGGNDCSITKTASKVDVDPNDKNEIMKAIADEMASCWWMFGEGKIDYGAGLLGSSSVGYALCSIIEFDDKVQEKIKEISYSEFYNYLKTIQKEGSQNYLNYLYGVNDVNYLVIESQFTININQDKIMTNQRYSILTGIDNYLIEKNKILRTYIIPTSETSSRLKQGEFITKP
ncbi:MAG: hypothetical protein ABIH65_02165 [Nanoarchaeota archaeon]